MMTGGTPISRKPPNDNCKQSVTWNRSTVNLKYTWEKILILWWVTAQRPNTWEQCSNNYTYYHIMELRQLIQAVPQCYVCRLINHIICILYLPYVSVYLPKLTVRICSPSYFMFLFSQFSYLLGAPLCSHWGRGQSCDWALHRSHQYAYLGRCWEAAVGDFLSLRVEPWWEPP